MRAAGCDSDGYCFPTRYDHFCGTFHTARTKVDGRHKAGQDHVQAGKSETTDVGTEERYPQRPPTAASEAAAAGRRICERDHAVTPIDLDFVDHFQLLEGATTWDPDDEAVAARLREYDEPPPTYSRPHVDTNSLTINGPHGPVPVRVYRAHPSDGPAPPALLWIHGGAFIGGDLDMGESHDVATIICAETRFTVVTVDYRLANNGVHFPVPHDDVLAAWHWLSNGPLAANLAPDQLFIGGGSAGAKQEVRCRPRSRRRRRHGPRGSGRSPWPPQPPLDPRSTTHHGRDDRLPKVTHDATHRGTKSLARGRRLSRARKPGCRRPTEGPR